MLNYKIKEFKEFINLFNYPVIIVDENLNPIVINKKFTSFEKSSKETIKIKLEKSIENKEYLIKKEQDTIYFSINKSSVLIENKDYIILSFFNISQRKRLIEDLENKQILLNQLTEQLPQSIVLFEENIVYTNDTFEKLVGYSKNYIKDKSLLSFFEKKNKDILVSSLNKLKLSRRSKIDLSLTIMNKKNHSTPIKASIKRINYKNSHSFLAVLTNISNENTKLTSLEKVAYFDKLTSIFNRRKLDELLDLEYKISKRYERPLSALFFDIDHFKKVNDNYGHDIGDIVLSQLAKLISCQTRETDIFARWGGEEFILILPETLKEEAIKVAIQIRNSLTNTTFPSVGKITISIGISSLKPKERLNTFIKRLDNALYKAKQSGRDCYIVL